MISNGWLKKGKIPVKYSQPIHRKYVYKINQHSRIVIEDYFLIRNTTKRKINKCVSRTDTNPPFAFQTAFPRGTDFSVSTGRVKKLHTLLVSLYF